MGARTRSARSRARWKAPRRRGLHGHDVAAVKAVRPSARRSPLAAAHRLRSRAYGPGVRTDLTIGGVRAKTLSSARRCRAQRPIGQYCADRSRWHRRRARLWTRLPRPTLSFRLRRCRNSSRQSARCASSIRSGSPSMKTSIQRLTSWHVPANDLDKDHPVTLRGLLSMTAGIGVPGFLGYELGAPLPTLTQILDGTPPANSPPVTVIAVPGSAYHYSGGGYEIAEALMVDTLHAPFVEAMDETGAEAGRDERTRPSPSLCRMSLGRRRRPAILPTGRKSKAASMSFPSMPPPDFGRRRATSPISCSALAGRGVETARSLSRAETVRRC